MISVAIIGAGIGAQHAAGYTALPDRYRLRTVCDLDAARGRPLAQAHGAEFSEDFDAVLADPGIDLVDVCLPPHLHLKACLSALDSGKAVVCEKPLVTSLADLDRLSAKARATKRPVFPVFQYRFGTGMAQLRAVMEAGLTGACYSATLETHWNRDSAYYALPWRGTWDGEQGGAVLGHAIHIHDLLTVALGPVRSVFARLATRVNPIEVEDCAALSIEMDSGALVTSSVTLGAAQDRSRLKLIFEKATVESDQAPYAPAAKPWTFSARPPQDQSALDLALGKAGHGPAGFAGFLESVATALVSGTEGEVTLDDARRSIEFVTAVYASARANAPVELPLAPAHPLYSGWLP